MSSVRIELATEPQSEGDAPGYAPGTTLTGTVHWQDDGTDHTLMVSLLWYTEGRGTEDVSIIHQVKVDAAAPSGQAPFTLDLPGFPWSFSGTLISLKWAVEASLEPGGAIDRTAVTIAPDGQEVII